METKRYVALEISSNKIKMLVGYTLNSQVYVLSVKENKCIVLKDGTLQSKDDIIKAIKALKESIEKELEITINSTYVILPPFSFECIASSGTTRTHSGSNIDAIDIKNALDYAKNMELSSQSIFIDTLPYLYRLDNSERLTFLPLGRKATHIEIFVKHYAIHKASKDFFDSIFLALNIKVLNYIISPHAAARYLALNENLPTSYFLVDMGQELTTFSLIQGGKDVLSSKIHRFSGRLLSEEIANNLNITIDKAEDIKCLYGLDENPNFDFEIEKGITLSKVSDIIKNYFVSFMEMLNKFIKYNSKSEEHKIPILIIGGGMNLKGITRFLASKINYDVLRPIPSTYGARKTSYISLLGAMVYAKEKEDFLNALQQNEEVKVKENEFDLTREVKNGTSKL